MATIRHAVDTLHPLPQPKEPQAASSATHHDIVCEVGKRHWAGESNDIGRYFWPSTTLGPQALLSAIHAAAFDTHARPLIVRKLAHDLSANTLDRRPASTTWLKGRHRREVGMGAAKAPTRRLDASSPGVCRIAAPPNLRRGSAAPRWQKTILSRAFAAVLVYSLTIRCLLLAIAFLELAGPRAWAGPSDQEYPLDVDLGDRVDPVRPGQDIVYELEVENFTSAFATDVVVTDTLPEGISFVIAHREPHWEEVTAIVEGNQARFELGDVAPCDQAHTPRCRDLWLVLRVAPTLPEGVRLTNRVTVTSSDSSLSSNQAKTVTTVASAAIRYAKAVVGRPGRDRIDVHADLARSGLHTALDPATPTINMSEGISLLIGPPAGPPIFEMTLAASEIVCPDRGNPLRRVHGRLRNKKGGKRVGLRKFDVILPSYLAAQHNNAHLRLKLTGLAIPASGATPFTLTLIAKGKVFAQSVVLEPKKSGRVLKYSQPQGEPLTTRCGGERALAGIGSLLWLGLEIEVEFVMLRVHE